MNCFRNILGSSVHFLINTNSSDNTKILKVWYFYYFIEHLDGKHLMKKLICYLNYIICEVISK